MSNKLLCSLFLLAGCVSFTARPPVCNLVPQAGQVAIELDEHGLGLARIEYPMPLTPCPVSIVITPRAFNAEFEAARYFVEPIDAEGFSLGVLGTPHETITFMWQAMEYQP